MMDKKLAIVGASGHGKVVADLAELCGYDVVFFDDAYPEKQKIEHYNIEGSFTDLLKSQHKYSKAIVAIGNNKIRLNLSKQLSHNGFALPSLIHPASIVSKYAKVADGSVVFAGSVINAFAQVGENCIINTGAVVEHDCVLGNAVHLSPNVALAGATIIGDSAWIGIGAVTCQLIEIGKNSIVGANSTVINNIPADVTAFGSPAVVKTSY